MKLTAALLSAIVAVGQAKNYAVLVAGSNTYSNYRHQSDVFHAYQILTANGYTDDDIILMAYDDIADARQNPFPGQVFNAPTDEGTAGADVYPGTDSIDYTGDDVTAENFLKVLTGDSSAGGPVLQTTSDDKVFVNFVDHGAAGLVAFPTGAYLYAQDLVDSLQTMSDNDMFSELVFYLEACESGSMFEGLDLPDNFYATTAANADEPSWGTYCSPDDSVDGQSIGSCLGDLYSVNWMEDSDVARHMKSETLDEQYTAVAAATTKSEVMKFGDDSVGSELISAFQSASSANLRRGSSNAELGAHAQVDSRHMKLQYLLNQYTTAPASEHEAILAEIAAETADREQYDTRFAAIVEKVTGSADNLTSMMAPVTRVMEHNCHKIATESYAAMCGRFSDYGFSYVKTLANMCDAGYAAQKIVVATSQVCA